MPPRKHGQPKTKIYRGHERSKAICGQIKRNGEPCAAVAGTGTDHPGRGACWRHGGNRRTEKKKELVKEAHAEFGAWADIDPAEAVMLCIRITSGEVFYFDARVKELEREQVTLTPTSTHRTTGGEWGSSTTISTTNDAKLNIYIKARQESVDRLMKYSTLALQLGLEERKVRMAEQWGQMFGQLIKGVMEDLQLTPSQRERAPAIVRERLLQLEARTPS